MKTIIHFLGIAGSGKGTQSKLLAKKTNWPIIEVGAICRALAAEDSEQGRMIKATIEAGNLIPYNITVQAVFQAVKNNPSSILMIDGFPRSLEQQSAFSKLLINEEIKLVIIHLIISEDEAMKRLLKRRELEGRADDNPESISKRFAIYYQDSLLAIEALKSQAEYFKIPGEKSIEEVQADITQSLLNLQLI